MGNLAARSRRELLGGEQLARWRSMPNEQLWFWRGYKIVCKS